MLPCKPARLLDPTEKPFKQCGRDSLCDLLWLIPTRLKYFAEFQDIDKHVYVQKASGCRSAEKHCLRLILRCSKSTAAWCGELHQEVLVNILAYNLSGSELHGILLKAHRGAAYTSVALTRPMFTAAFRTLSCRFRFNILLQRAHTLTFV